MESFVGMEWMDNTLVHIKITPPVMWKYNASEIQSILFLTEKNNTLLKLLDFSLYSDFKIFISISISISWSRSFFVLSYNIKFQGTYS